MIPCSKDCIHQTDGYCILGGEAKVTSTSESCAYYLGRNATRKTMSNKLQSLTDGADINKLNRVGDIGAH